MITFKKFFGEYVRNRKIYITNAKSKSSLTNYVHFPIMFEKFIGVPTNQTWNVSPHEYAVYKFCSTQNETSHNVGLWNV
jgi:hypothetical protein